MESATTNSPNPSNGGPQSKEEKPMVVVIMGPTGAGKSRLAIDLASHFPIEIINADSMQVYRGLDVLTNKVPLDEQKGKNKLNSNFLSSYGMCQSLAGHLSWIGNYAGVPHHLLGTVNPNVEFTAKLFRDSAIPVSIPLY